ncbi:RluA family pseudouridine synthase [Candidatus Peregrinibacteria bacterium]|nr:RluA family pseudouridine synthase [Candidatus Peregrinibacteria bacterium]
MFGASKLYRVNEEMIDKRLDIFIVESVPEITRSYLKNLFNEKRVEVNGVNKKPSYLCRLNDIVKVSYPEIKKININPTDIPLKIIYEDQYILIVDKPAGLVVHPDDAGNHVDFNLVSAVLNHTKENLSPINGTLRPGIVHRLDKDTSGMVIVAKGELAHKNLVKMFKNKQITKKYLALVEGMVLKESFKIIAPIGRSKNDRKKMSIDGINSKEAITEVKLIKNYNHCSLLEISLITGRTHQIRVHLSSIGHSIIGDQKYGSKKAKSSFNRQFLHAYYLKFNHPVTKKPLEFEIALSVDLNEYLKSI